MASRGITSHSSRPVTTINQYVVLSLCLGLVFLPHRLLANNNSHTEPLPTSELLQTSAKARVYDSEGPKTTSNGIRYTDVGTSNATVGEDPSVETRVEQPSGEQEDIVSRFLAYLDFVERSPTCEAGTWAVTLDKGATSYGPNRYMKQAMKTVQTANFLTRIWRSNALDEVQHNEEFFFNVVASNVENDDKIFAFGNCYDAYEFQDYNIFCPYAYRFHGGILVKDLSLAYPYLNNNSEWFYEARMNANKILDKRRTINTTFIHRYNDTDQRPAEHADNMLVTYEDGHWSAPYFDCEGGNIWMITYTVPFLGSHPNGSYYFKGTSGLDIDLRAIDINQCPEDPNEENERKEKNIFAGSDRCHNDSQECIFLKDQGFRRGTYQCRCRAGFYFPLAFSNPPGDTYFNGTDMETEYDAFKEDKPNQYNEMVCKPCGAGCDTCVDGRSCRFPHNWTVRTVLLILQCITMGCTLPLFIFTIYNRDVKVVKAASPVLLRIILVGSLFLYCPVLVSFYEPTVVTCMLLQWFKEVGFSILFGALLLKTWRISVVFRVRSAARVRITDVDLMKRLGLIVAVSIFYLIVRSVIAPPKVETETSLDKLKAEQCKYDWWDYAANIAELVLLLWGVRLCYVVRKAPSEFNESRFISWAIYNETMLSLFLCVATFFLQDLANPDLLYIIWFLYSQLTTTVVLALLFGSKIYLVSQGKGDKTESRIKTATTAFRQRTWDNSLSSQGLMAKTSSSEMEKPLNQRDIEDELKRLYTQLEQLKTRNMVVGNPHLTRKLTEMAEVARETEQMLMDTEMPNNVNGVHEISYSLNNNGRTSNSQADWI